MFFSKNYKFCLFIFAKSEKFVAFIAEVRSFIKHFTLVSLTRICFSPTKIAFDYLFTRTKRKYYNDYNKNS